jgi:hypothetical protein
MGRWKARKWFLALLTLVPTVVVGGDRTPASAIPHIQYFGEEYELRVANFPSTLCVGQKKTITAWVKQYGLYKNLSTNTNMRARRPRIYRVDRGQNDVSLARTKVQISNPSVLAKGTEEHIVDTVLWIRVPVKATKVGTTDVNISAERPGVTAAGTTIRVRVTECDYKVHEFSMWHINAGRNIVAASTIDTIITGRNHPPGKIYNDHAEAKNTAISFDPPCVAVYELPSSAAGIFAVRKDDILQVEVDYDPNDASTAVTCLVVSGGNQDDASRDQNNFTIPVEGGSWYGPHVLHAPGIGDFTGFTLVTFTPIPQ